MNENKSNALSDGKDETLQAKDISLTISKMSKQYNVTVRTLRFYESIGLLRPKREGTTRLYSLQDCQSLEITLRGKMLGFSLAEIHDFIEMRSGMRLETDLEFTLEPEQILTQIRFLERQREDIDRALDCLNRAYQKISNAGELQKPGGEEAAP